jgi:hypothetical protein
MRSLHLIGPLLAISLGGSAAADEPPQRSRVLRPWAAQAEVGYTPGGPPGTQHPGDAYWGVTATRTWLPWLDVQASLGRGLDASTATRDGTTTFNTGTHARLLGRALLALDRAGRHTLYAGAGPLLLISPSFGSVPLGHVEVGYELRGGPVVLTWGIGLSLALADSRGPITDDACYRPAPNCSPRFKIGEGAVINRLALGVSF